MQKPDSSKTSYLIYYHNVTLYFKINQLSQTLVLKREFPTPSTISNVILHVIDDVRLSVTAELSFRDTRPGRKYSLNFLICWWNRKDKMYSSCILTGWNVGGLSGSQKCCRLTPFVDTLSSPSRQTRATSFR